MWIVLALLLGMAAVNTAVHGFQQAPVGGAHAGGPAIMEHNVDNGN